MSRIIFIIFSLIICFNAKAQNTTVQHYGHLSLGENSPNIVLKDINAQETSLSYLKGRYILIQFWASWCKPCRMENHIIKNTYSQFKNQKFKNGDEFLVLSVSLDENPANWKRAVHEDNIYEFVNVIDSQGVDSDIAKRYNVSSIPANFLLDGSGKIIAKNFRANELDEILKTFIN
ncbi:MAG: TlpA family protein disulfide reductase [Bacteroidales bacterium]|nr:TlpA family protein disulfide reductase [Bacteroidales bacterium]